MRDSEVATSTDSAVKPEAKWERREWGRCKKGEANKVIECRGVL